jgi:hypothetical protein
MSDLRVNVLLLKEEILLLDFYATEASLLNIQVRLEQDNKVIMCSILISLVFCLSPTS